MASVPERLELSGPGAEERLSLAREWRRLGRFATFVAILTSPVVFVMAYQQWGWGLLPSVLTALVAVVAFRGLVDVLVHRLIPQPSLYGADKELLDQDIVARRRLWYWRRKYKRWSMIIGTTLVALVTINLIQHWTGNPQSLADTFSSILDAFIAFLAAAGPLLFLFPLYFLFN